MSQPNDPAIAPPIHLNAVGASLHELHARVSQRHQRVEIVDADAGEPCVLIAKSDLESLERALEILADADALRQTADAIASAAARCR